MSKNSYLVCTIKDRLAKKYSTLFQTPNELTAARSFKQMLEGTPGANRLDYDLIVLGTYDQDSSLLTTLKRPRILYVAPDLKNGKKKN